MTDTTAGEGVYRKTATIRATQWFKMGDHPAVKPYYKDGHTNDPMGKHGWIDTLEGGHVVTPGDWIATGIQGEHWPIKPDVFAATYALATPAQPDTGDVAALREDGPFVAGPVWQETDITDEDGNIIWTSEVQTVGGWSVVATVHGETEDEAKQRRDACLAALWRAG